MGLTHIHVNNVNKSLELHFSVSEEGGSIEQLALKKFKPIFGKMLA